MADRQPTVTIVDVFARDGLQTLLHEPDLRTPTTDEKVAVIAALDAVGVPEIEITGFVHPRVIPSLADAEEVARRALAQPHRAMLKALVPNVRGAERALAVGMPKIGCLIVASETYQNLNSHMSVEQNVRQIEEIVRLAAGTDTIVTVGMGTSFLCPYDGLLAEDYILGLVERFANAGITELSLADSIGMAWPSLVRDRVAAVKARWPQMRVGLHLHTLGGLAPANAWAGYEAGAEFFEGSVGGIGGGIAMPVHTTNMGNIATEDLVYLFESCGVATHVDAPALAKLGREAQALIGTGMSYAASFGTLDAFLASSREQLEVVRAAPPGDSHR